MLTWIRCGRLITRAGLPAVEDGALLVRAGVIEAVGPAQALPAPPEAQIVDLRPWTALPGLIDAHVHLVGSPEPGALLATSRETDAWLLLRAAANARAALAAGITTVRDCGGRGDLVIWLARAVTAGLVPGPRIVSCGTPITVTGGHCHFLGLEAEGVDGVRRAVRQMHKAGADFIKVMVTGGGLTAGSNPRASQYGAAELAAMAEDAHRLGKRIAGHAHGTEGIRWAVAAGFDTLEHCSWLARHGEGRDYTQAVVEEIVSRGIYVCRTIAGFERVPMEEAGPHHPLWADYAPLREMARSNVRLMAGTDAGIDHTPFNSLPYAMETMAGMGGMSPAAVLAAATVQAAAGLGLASQIGCLEPGRRADLIAVDGDPLDDLRVLRTVRAVLRDGQIVAQDGKVIG